MNLHITFSLLWISLCCAPKAREGQQIDHPSEKAPRGTFTTATAAPPSSTEVIQTELGLLVEMDKSTRVDICRPDKGYRFRRVVCFTTPACCLAGVPAAAAIGVAAAGCDGVIQ